MGDNILTCIVCDKSEVNKGDEFNLVGGCKSKGGTDSLETYATMMKEGDLLAKIKEKKNTKEEIYIHLSCRTKLRNGCRRKRSLSCDEVEIGDTNKRRTRSDFNELF